MKIIDLSPDDATMVLQTAQLLVDGFRQVAPTAWPDMDTALVEVHQSLAPERISRVMVTDQNVVVGWIGGLPFEGYGGNVYELHPLVVHSDYRGRGIGKALVADLERIIADRGAQTIFLGSDDENGLTTLSGVDLYPNVLEHLASIHNLHNHPFEFYQKVGFVLIGVMPDASGPGKPDIYMAKRVRKSSE